MSKLKKALEKAKQTRHETEGEMVQEASRKLDRCDINPTYECTEVVSVDPALLRKNKVISLCHENGVADQIKILRTQVLKGIKELLFNTSQIDIVIVT